MDKNQPVESRQTELLVLCTIMLALSTLFTFLRCMAVIFSKNHRFGLDDFFAIITWVSCGISLIADSQSCGLVIEDDQRVNR